MKTRPFVVMILLAFSSALAVPAVSAESETKDKAPSKTALKKYDKDKDGVLNADELAAQQADKDKAKEKRAEKKKEKENAATAP